MIFTIHFGEFKPPIFGFPPIWGVEKNYLLPGITTWLVSGLLPQYIPFISRWILTIDPNFRPGTS